MSFTRNILTLIQEPNWQKEKFWLTYDERWLSCNEMTTEHLINICRQIVNEACLEMDVEPIPVKNVLAYIDFEVAAPLAWVTLCRAFFDEIARRLNTPRISNSSSQTIKASNGVDLSPGYMAIWLQIQNRIQRLRIRALASHQNRLPAAT